WRVEAGGIVIRKVLCPIGNQRLTDAAIVIEVYRPEVFDKHVRVVPPGSVEGWAGKEHLRVEPVSESRQPAKQQYRGPANEPIEPSSRAHNRLSFGLDTSVGSSL